MDFFNERPDSREVNLHPDSVVLKYVCGREGDEYLAAAYAIQATPYIHDNLFRQSMAIKPVGGGIWNVDVTYGPYPEPQRNAYRVRYDTTGGTARKTHAISHVASYAPSGKTAPAHNGAINVAPDGRPEGVDVVVPTFKWSEEHTLPVSICGWAYSQVLKALSGRVNQHVFRGFPQGQVLFTGATGGYSSESDDDQNVQVTFNFEQQDTISNATYDTITGVTKVGWEYLWFEHAQEDDTTAKRLKSKLIAVHREVLYDMADFSLLQIGS